MSSTENILREKGKEEDTSESKSKTGDYKGSK
jgi:hypothetical protein